MHSSTPYNIFRLLVPATATTPHDAPTIELEGNLWTTTDDAPLIDGAVPEYTCVSYSWGSGKTPNPFVADQWMSHRLIPVLQTAIRALRPTAIWVDALCMPAREPERTACLRSMGALYAAAAHVIAVLSQSCAVLLGEVARTGSLGEAGLLLLENDEWVSRVWTYQEIVNSKRFWFTAEAGSVALSGSQFLSELGNAIEQYKKRHGCDSFTLRALHPRLDSLEDTVADWLTADFAHRSAYQAMSSMDRRCSERKEDYFNALIGAITAEPLRHRDETALHPAEYFMRVCEAKGDFSFIYSSAPRSHAPGRSWRPLAGPMPAIQPWHTFGDGQVGCLHPGHVQLHNLCRMTRGPVSPTANQFIRNWLQNSGGAAASGITPDRILTRLRQAGFAGCGDVIELEAGYFFPQTADRIADNLLVFVPVGIRWAHGGPGMLTAQENGERYQFGDVGVFVGPHPKSGDSIDLA